MEPAPAQGGGGGQAGGGESLSLWKRLKLPATGVLHSKVDGAPSFACGAKTATPRPRPPPPKHTYMHAQTSRCAAAT